MFAKHKYLTTTAVYKRNEDSEAQTYRNVVTLDFGGPCTDLISSVKEQHLSLQLLDLDSYATVKVLESRNIIMCLDCSCT